MKLDRVIAVRNLKTVYRDGDRCVKVFGKGYKKQDVFSEALNQAKAEETGLNVPKVLEVSMIEGKWVIVTEYIKGKSLAQLMKENPDETDQYTELLVDLQLQVQSKSCPFLYKLKDKLKSKIVLADLDEDTRSALLAQIESMDGQNLLCHGDFIPSNIIIRDDGTPFILDWSHMTTGDAAADFAMTYLLFLMNEDKDGADRYLNLLCQKINISEQQIKKWVPVVAASQSIKGNIQKREFMLAQVNLSDFS